MPDVLALLQTGADSATEPSTMSESWRLLELPPAWVIVLIILPLAAAVALAAYWRENVPSRVRWLLTGFRLASIVLLLLVLARPVKVRQHQDVQPAEVLLLVDDSASMARADDYASDPDIRTALRRFADGAETADRTRSELARQGADELEGHLEEKGYVTTLLRFAQSSQAISDLDRLDASGRATHVGDALRQALASYRGRHVTDVVLITDGRSNGGVSPEEVAASSGVRVSGLLVGDSNPERNVAVELVDAPESVLEGDDVELAFRVTERGGDGSRESVELILEELPVDGRGDPIVVANERVELSASGDRTVLVADADAYDPGATERRFRARVEPVEGERNTQDNEALVTVGVNRERVRVLYVEGYPRYEYRFLNFMLKRSDARIDVQMYLLSADREFPQERTRGLEPLERVPTSREELLANYDVVLLGDLNPYNVSTDPAEGQEFVRSLIEFVELGGGLGIIAGPYDMPGAVIGTEFEQLLPVELDRGGFVVDVPTDVEHRPRLENPAAPHPLVRFEQDLEQNRALWESARGLRGFFWHYPVAGPKPGAQVLLRHPIAESGVGGEKDPLLVLGYFPAGRTLFLAIEATNRWQFRYDTRYFESFWRSSLRWLALGRLKSGDRRYRLEPLRTEYDLDERVTLEARVLDEDFRPAELESQEVRVAGDGGETEPLELAAVPGRPGVFRGTFQAERPGRYRAWIEAEGRRRTSTEFSVVLPSRETADPRPDPESLARVADLGGGTSYPLHEIDRLMADLGGGEEKREPISSELEDAWDRWATLLFALGLLSCEWILRKRYELV